ncbi:uncharacterized protein LTHEOB_522 [Lasiodiplodia theobromae]|uniref:uncharacterized protein n=1 Tax=Lasiodiplodia theobromae TaxID=45133 RepID=UPI0015C3F1EB|nr:uncharacterized protein LTHEOB_522 [Lasiodiplodia theobromae]KAF4543823.1 hypothetical protein LTHEOB_522 [Lasiodiplodia theobromae]
MLDTSEEAVYCLVDRGGLQWPAVYCSQEMIPVHEVEIRPSGYHLPVLLLGVFEFQWVLYPYDFDPSARENITDGPQQRQLQEAFDSILNSTPGCPAYPKLNYWRSEMVARDLQNIVTSSSEKSSNNSALRRPRNTKSARPSVKDAKRSWEKFKINKEFGEEFRHSKKKSKIKAGAGKCTHHWFPDEDEDNAKPPVGYFENLRKEKEKEEMENEKLFLNISDDDDDDDDDDSTSDGDTKSEGGATSGSSDEENTDDTNPPVSRSHLSVKKGSQDIASEASVKTSVRPQPARSKQPNSSKSSSTRPGQADNEPAVTKLCRELDGARANSDWDQAETAANQLIQLAPWSDDSTILIAKALFRVAPRPNVEHNFEDDLRDAVTEHIHCRYEQLRATKNSMLAMLLRDHEDLAEMVYAMRLKELREKRVEVVEID